MSEDETGGGTVAEFRSREINPGVRYVSEGTRGCRIPNGVVYAVFELPQGTMPRDGPDFFSGILSIARETPITEGGFEIGYGERIDDVCPMMLSSPVIQPLTSFFGGRVKVYMPGAGPKSMSMTIADLLPDVRPDATPRDKRIAAFYDKGRIPVESFYKNIEPGLREIDTDALLMLEELLPTRNDDILRKFEARRLFS